LDDPVSVRINISVNPLEWHWFYHSDIDTVIRAPTSGSFRGWPVPKITQDSPNQVLEAVRLKILKV
jgi:hypothetical protein